MMSLAAAQSDPHQFSSIGVLIVVLVVLIVLTNRKG